MCGVDCFDLGFDLDDFFPCAEEDDFGFGCDEEEDFVGWEEEEDE